MTKRLLAFLSIGFLIFLLDILFEDFSDDKTIVIFDTELKGLIDTWTNQVGREPNENEFNGIINQLVDEEILYREALKLGLDKNDIIIKRRLSQKIGFLKQEQLRVPTDKEVEDYFRENQSSYVIPKRFSFTHIYFESDKDGKNRSLRALEVWNNSGELSYGDPFLLGKNFSLKTSKEVARDFGINFSKEIERMPVNNWSGPLKSSYGSHLVFVTSVVDEIIPSLKEIKSALVADLQVKQKEENFKLYLEELRNEYKIQVNKSLIQ